MKSFITSVLPLTALLASTLAAPAPAPAPSPDFSFPITDLIDSDLTLEEYAAQQDAAQQDAAALPALSKRQYTTSTYNQFSDGSACRDITVLYARGTSGAGNVGSATSVGPVFFNALAARVGGTSALAIQGVDYSATVLGFLVGGDPAGATELYNLILEVVDRCPDSKIVVSGYSQGAQLVHTATQRLSSANAAKVSAVVTFGDPDQDESFGSVAASKVLIICHDGDNICDNGIIITSEHINYQEDVDTAADFVAARV